MFNLKLSTFGFLLVVFSAILCNLIACDRVQKQTDHIQEIRTVIE